jgi:cobalt-zinc-cadmium resistance protein CzcA
MNRLWQIEQRLGLIKGQLEQSKAELATVMGIDEFDYDAPKFTFEVRNFNPSVDSSLVMDLQLKSDYMAKMKSAEWNQIFPSISLGYMNQQLGLVQGFEAFTIGAQIPLWFGPQKSRAQQFEIEQLMAENEVAHKTRELENKERALTEKAIYYSSILTDENAILRAEEVVDLANRKLAAGEISQFDYIQSVSTAYEIRLTQLEIIYQYQLTIAQLEYIQP